MAKGIRDPSPQNLRVFVVFVVRSPLTRLGRERASFTAKNRSGSGAWSGGAVEDEVVTGTELPDIRLAHDLQHLGVVGELPNLSGLTQHYAVLVARGMRVPGTALWR
ncbi:hypothetical protein, partial [Thioalkalivibrio sp.]|uniref:hypothetical protein n=1 Tax=Thioalkalivibrio sp. TaxID=2093813 RepID=UPI0039764A13